MPAKLNANYALNGEIARLLREEKPGSVYHQIAHTLITLLPTLHEMSIGEVASSCAVSKSTLSKFVRELGYDDYASFKEGASAYWEKERYHLSSGTNITDYLCSHGAAPYLDVLTQDLRRLVAGIDLSSLAHVVDLLHAGSQIGAFGQMYGYTAALNLYFKLAFYRRFVYVSENLDKVCQFVRVANEDSVVMLYSNSGMYLDGYGDASRMSLRDAFAKTQARIVLVTANRMALFDPRIDTCLLLPSNGSVHNHPFLYQMVNELIGAAYQRRYGFPEGMEELIV